MVSDIIFVILIVPSALVAFLFGVTYSAMRAAERDEGDELARMLKGFFEGRNSNP